MVLLLQEVDGEDEMENLQNNMTRSAFISYTLLLVNITFTDKINTPWNLREKTGCRQSSKNAISRATSTSFLQSNL